MILATNNKGKLEEIRKILTFKSYPKNEYPWNLYTINYYS